MILCKNLGDYFIIKYNLHEGYFTYYRDKLPIVKVRESFTPTWGGILQLIQSLNYLQGQICLKKSEKDEPKLFRDQRSSN